MMKIQSFCFNAFQENSYLLYDDTKECIIVDPGCSNASEESELKSFIEKAGLVPKILINTHCHIDHVLGNQFVLAQFGLKPWAHQGEVSVLEMCTVVAQMYGISYQKSPEIEKFIEEGDEISCGNFVLKALFTPGHSPASLSFYHQSSRQLIAGDVIFKGSIGRTDLPGGDYNTLISSIKTKLLPLGDEVKIYSGHGSSTNMGEERIHNPFLK